MALTTNVDRRPEKPAFQIGEWTIGIWFVSFDEHRHVLAHLGREGTENKTMRLACLRYGYVDGALRFDTKDWELSGNNEADEREALATARDVFEAFCGTAEKRGGRWELLRGTLGLTAFLKEALARLQSHVIDLGRLIDFERLEMPSQDSLS